MTMSAGANIPYSADANPQSGKRDEAFLRNLEHALPDERINREVIQHGYLGNDATVRPYQHPDVCFYLFRWIKRSCSDRLLHNVLKLIDHLQLYF
jgi:hypothetical protein